MFTDKTVLLLKNKHCFPVHLPLLAVHIDRNNDGTTYRESILALFQTQGYITLLALFHLALITAFSIGLLFTNEWIQTQRSEISCPLSHGLKKQNWEQHLSLSNSRN
jgi:hypothetical protein